MKWYNRDVIPQREATLILAKFKEDRLEELQIGRAQYFEGEFQIWSNDREFCHHGQILPKKFTHWAYENEYWKLLETVEREYPSNNYRYGDPL